jgi:soluble cytochrome b562
MKIRLLIATLLAALAVAAGLQAQPTKDDHTELGETMEKMSSAWRKAKAQLPDASKNADTLEKLAAVKQGMENSLKLEPARKADVPAAEQAKFVADYQAKMKEEIGKVDQLIALVKAGKTAEATALVGVIDQDQKDSHKAFKKQKKKAN